MIKHSKPATEPQRILLVDDNRHGNIARKALLEEAGYFVEAVTSGEDAWELLSRAVFDLVVTDLKMKGMDGLQLIARIRQAQTPCHIIMLSGWASQIGLTETTTGADLVMAKCCNEGDQLTRAVRHLLAKRKPAASQKRSPTASVARSG